MKAATVTVGTTAQNLLALCVAIDPGFKSTAMGSSSAREMIMQSDPTNTGNIYIGDAKVASPSPGPQRCGYNLLAGGTALHRAIMEDVPFEDWWAVASAAGQLLNVMTMRK